MFTTLPQVSLNLRVLERQRLGCSPIMYARQARVRVRLGSDSWTRSVQNVSSQWLQFESFAPAVSALVSGQLTNIPTLGTPAVATVQVQYMLVRMPEREFFLFYPFFIPGVAVECFCYPCYRRPGGCGPVRPANRQLAYTVLRCSRCAGYTHG